MPTSTVYASLPTSRKPAHKRRRLNPAVEAEYQSSRALTDNSNVAPTPNATLSSPCTKLSCLTCHRALSTAIRPGVACPAMCSRCSAPTCAICARTCTSYTRPSSLPPTPALTRSPSPSTHAPTPISPKRPALGLNLATMNSNPSLTLSIPAAPAIKRKKAPIDKEDMYSDGTPGRDHLHPSFIAESVVIPGCGRVVCRACCVESVPNDGKLCVDCFALV